MSQQHEHELQRRQLLSALMDGEADTPSVAPLCAAWRDDADARATWHAWHLIGDVLRSDDLAAPVRRDARFVASLRQRLGAEPVVLAPVPQRRARRAWSSAAAVAAGFVLVVGAVLVVDMNAPGDAPVQLAGRTAAPTRVAESPVAPAQPAAPVAVLSVAPPEVAVPLAEPQVLVADGKLIRDARLDHYLAAHKPFGGNPALAMPTGFVRARAGNVDSGR